MRCFVAVWPSPDVLAALAALPRPALDGVRWTTQDQWHVTLRFFGELGEADVARATSALARVAGSVPGPVLAEGGPATRLLGPGLVVWPVEGLAAVARAVEKVTAKFGQPVPNRHFFGHLTIARGRSGADLRRMRDALLAPLAASWPAAGLSLVQSQLHPGGARYRDIATFPFGPGVAGPA